MMDSKKLLLWVCLTIGGGLGAYIPVWLFGADPFGLWGIIGGMIGGFIAIWIWYKLSKL